MSWEDDFKTYLKRFKRYLLYISLIQVTCIELNRATIDSLKASKIHFAHTHESFDAVPLELKWLSFPRARFQDKEI